MKIRIKQDTQKIVAAVGIQGPAGANSLSAMSDIDTSELTTGSILVYEEQTATWKSTIILDKQAIDAGHF